MTGLPSLFSSDAKAMLDAINRSQAIIEFDLSGTILTANENFCRAMGYDLHEIVGRHHRMFVQPEEAASAAYADFWARLARGQFDSQQYRRIGKGGREIWIEASYNPVFGPDGRPVKVIKLAIDITADEQEEVENELAALAAEAAKPARTLPEAPTTPAMPAAPTSRRCAASSSSPRTRRCCSTTNVR